MRATAPWVLLCFALAGCQCVRAPEVRYACANDEDCLATERCVAGHCAGTDAGSDGGADGGCTAGSMESDCANGADDDCDTFTDCDDDDCTNQICRPAIAPCDLADLCVNHSCPLDGWRAINDVCDDEQPCTTDSRCLVDAGCAGVSGEAVFQCFAYPLLHNLVVGTCPTTTCAFDGGSVLFREVPDAVAPGFSVFSVAIDAGADAGGACFFDVCIDWRLATSTPAGYCSTNTFLGKVSATPGAGLVPVYQYRSAAGLSSFGLSEMPPGGATLDPAVPLFFACPP